MSNDKKTAVHEQKPLVCVLTRGTLKLLAGGGAFHRGEEYFNEGFVESLAVDQERASAIVQGTRAYRCNLRAKGEGVQGDCTCPAYEDAGFCKHLVAVGLAVMEPEPKADEPDIRERIRPRKRDAKSVDSSIEKIRAHLSELSHERLVEMLIDRAINDAPFLRSLRVGVLERKPSGIEGKTSAEVISALKDAIDQATQVENGDEWPDEYETARELEALIERTEALLKAGHAAGVVELAEYFLAAVDPIIECFHEGGCLVDVLERIQKIHLRACRMANLDQEDLAKRLFEWGMTSDWSLFENAAEEYADALGPKGFKTYRSLAEEEWAKIPETKTGRPRYGGSESRLYRITEIMENLAKLTGDADALAAIKAKDLSSGWRYLEVAEIYAAHKMRDKALTWAEVGLKAFPDRPDGRLREFIAREYHRLKRHGEAMALIWEEFVDHPILDRFKALKTHAKHTKSWKEWRKKAIDHLEGLVRTAKTAGGRAGYGWEKRDHNSTLIEIHLWEKDVEAAWKRAEADGASTALWYRLAEIREKDRPSDVVSVYQSLVEAELPEANNDAYRQAVKLIVKIQDLMKRTKQENEFPGYLQEVRRDFKAKRNFIKLLDAAF